MRYKNVLCIMFFSLFILGGCNESFSDRYDRSKVGELRHKIFVECMELAAKITRQADDDVSDIVDQCSNEAYYMANHMTP